MIYLLDGSSSPVAQRGQTRGGVGTFYPMWHQPAICSAGASRVWFTAGFPCDSSFPSMRPLYNVCIIYYVAAMTPMTEFTRHSHVRRIEQ